MLEYNNRRIIYFAGSVTDGGGYRGILFHRKIMDEYHSYEAMKNTTLEILYGGPTAFGSGHACSHMRATHGNGSEDSGLDLTYYENQRYLVDRCLLQIRVSDGLFAYITTLDCFGTLAEIGYASSQGKPIQIIIDEALRPLLEVNETIDEAYGAAPVREYLPCEYTKMRNEFWFVLALPGVRWRFGLVPDFDETVFSRRCCEDHLVSSRELDIEHKEVVHLKDALRFIERETCRIADKGSAMWRELLTAVIVKPIREILDK